MFMSTYAGFIAEERHTGKPNREEFEYDLEVASSYLVKLDGPSGKVMERLSKRTGELVEEHWRFVEAVAQRLLRERRIEGPELRVIRAEVASVSQDD